MTTFAITYVQPKLSALIIMDARDRTHVDQLLAEDPFISEGVVTELTVLRWEPIFGALVNTDPHRPQPNPGASHQSNP